MISSQRPSIITANWKMYKTIQESTDFIKKLIPRVKDSPAQIFIAAPFTSIQALAVLTKGTAIQIGAQNMNDATEGAFTGEVAARMLKDAGASFVILGHSERRHLFHEDNAFINRKIKRALESGLRPVLCIGETKEERDANKAIEVLHTQLKESLAGFSAEALSSLIVAYEPIWAIGVGHQAASPETAEEMHLACRQFLSELFGAKFAEALVIQYGGSVNTKNASALLRQQDIDGLLIGGASLSLESFVEIVNDRSYLDVGSLQQ